MRRRKPKSTILSTQAIFNLPHHIGMVCEKLVFDDAVSFTQQGKWIAAQLNVMAVIGIQTCHQAYQPSAKANWPISPPPQTQHTGGKVRADMCFVRDSSLRMYVQSDLAINVNYNEQWWEFLTWHHLVSTNCTPLHVYVFPTIQAIQHRSAHTMRVSRQSTDEASCHKPHRGSCGAVNLSSHEYIYI